MITAIDHIGIAVSDLEAAMARYKGLFGVETFHRERVEDQGVEIASFELNGVRIELTAPTSEATPIGKFIASRGEGIHHIAFRSDAIREDLSNARANGIQLINDEPRMGAHEMLIAFLHPKSTGGVLMEFCQHNSLV
jgi:methylmalonyl-CoA/ethylmalonyl-CoA epimerase